LKLPYYGVFDNIAFEVKDDTVILYGQVVRPTTRSDAARRVAKIEGVDRVVNKIEVLPLSRFDDEIRARTYRAVFSKGGLYRYAAGTNPSLHIIVRNGVPGVFSVTNNLRVERNS
jgi:hyperosmotically inducible protein